MLREWFILLFIAVVMGFFVGALLFVPAIVVAFAFIFSGGMRIASVGDAFLLFLSCWFVGSVIVLFVRLTGPFGVDR